MNLCKKICVKDLGVRKFEKLESKPPMTKKMSAYRAYSEPLPPTGPERFSYLSVTGEKRRWVDGGDIQFLSIESTQVSGGMQLDFITVSSDYQSFLPRIHSFGRSN